MADLIQGPRAHEDADLSPEQLTELAERLASKRHELQERIANLEEEIVTKDDCSHADPVDAASAQESRMRARGLAEQDRQSIGEIDAALRRLQIGTYGVSEYSGEPIGYQRLMLIPWARRAADD